jgi:hypothetical protein
MCQDSGLRAGVKFTHYEGGVSLTFSRRIHNMRLSAGFMPFAGLDESQQE